MPNAKGLQWVSDRNDLHMVWEGSISLSIDLQTVAIVNDEGFLFCILSRQRPILQGVQQIPHDLHDPIGINFCLRGKPGLDPWPYVTPEGLR